MREEGTNCKECGWPAKYSDKFCGHCGAILGGEKKKEGDEFKLIGYGFKVFILVVTLFLAVIGSVFLFPIGFLAWIIPVAIYQQWFGSKSKLKECRCCHKKISKEALECPKCGCPHPIN